MHGPMNVKFQRVDILEVWRVLLPWTCKKLRMWGRGGTEPVQRLYVG